MRHQSLIVLMSVISGCGSSPAHSDPPGDAAPPAPDLSTAGAADLSMPPPDDAAIPDLAGGRDGSIGADGSIAADGASGGDLAASGDLARADAAPPVLDLLGDLASVFLVQSVVLGERCALDGTTRIFPSIRP